MDLQQGVLNVILGLIILVGALQCFFGYRIFKFILGLTGFLIGGLLAGAIGGTFSQELVFVLMTAIAGGLIGAFLMVAMYFVGVFLIGAMFGGILGAVIYAIAEMNPDPVALLLLAVISGILSLIIQKFMIIISTGFGGAMVVVVGMALFITNTVSLSHPEQMMRTGESHMYAILLSWLALGLTGVFVQYRSASREKASTINL